MTAWKDEDLERIDAASEVTLESERADGSLRVPVPMWAVRAGDHAYVRAVNGPTSPWFRGVRSRQRGRVSAGGAATDVSFDVADSAELPVVDAAYRAKYGEHPHLGMVLTDQARQATLRLTPR
jgi:hypothetical protein